MRFLLLAMIVCSARAQTVTDIVHEYSEREASRYDRARNYTYRQHATTRRYDRHGRMQSISTATYEILIVNGKPVQTLIESNGSPVTQQESIRRQQALEQAAHAAPRFEDRYYEFRLEGEEEVNGRMTWVVSARMKEGAGARIITATEGARRKLNVKVWIDQSDFECARLQSDVLINGFGLDGKVHAVNSGLIEFMRIADGVVLPTRAVFRNDSELPLTVFPLSLAARRENHWEIEVLYTDYKNFQTDSRMLEAPAGRD